MSLLDEAVTKYNKLLESGPFRDLSWAEALNERMESEKLSAGGETNRCGWLRDKFGISWQIVPSALRELMADKDPEKSQRVMKAMLHMDKLDIKTLQQARG